MFDWFNLNNYKTIGALALSFVLLFAVAESVLRARRSGRSWVKAFKDKCKGKGARGSRGGGDFGGFDAGGD